MLISLLLWIYAGIIFYLLGSFTFTITIIEKVSKRSVVSYPALICLVGVAYTHSSTSNYKYIF